VIHGGWKLVLDLGQFDHWRGFFIAVKDSVELFGEPFEKGSLFGLFYFLIKQLVVYKD
jgi:hypothetical protein